jgi:hypothetical protein
VRRRGLLAFAKAPYVRVLHPRSRGAGTDQRDGLDHVVHRARTDLLEQVAHAGRLDLETTDGASLAQELRRSRVVLRDRFEVHLDAALRERAHAVVDHRQRTVAEQVHLDQADRLDPVLVELCHEHTLGCTLTGDVVGDRPGGDDDPARMQPEVPGRIDEPRGDAQCLCETLVVEREAGCLGGREEGERDRVRGQLGVGGERRWKSALLVRCGSRCRSVCGVLCRDTVERPRSRGRMVREPPGPTAYLDRRDAERERCFAESRAKSTVVQGRDHRRALGGEELVEVFDDLVAPTPAEVEVDVRSVAARGVEEAFEQEPVAQRVGVGQREAVGDEAVRRRPASDARDLLASRVVREVLDEQEVRREAEPVDRRELVVEPPDDLGPQWAVATACAVEGELAELRVGRLVFFELDRGEVHAAELGRERAARGDLERALQRAGYRGRSIRRRSIRRLCGRRIERPRNLG